MNKEIRRNQKVEPGFRNPDKSSGQKIQLTDKSVS